MTRQWFSVAVNAKKTLDPAAVIIEGVKVLDVIRHDKKLRPGMHRGNQFVIRLRDVEGDASLLTQRFETVCQQGVPNYFGEQRFGRAAGNLELAVTLQDQHPSVWRERQYQFALSAIRSWLFNTVLAARVANGTWQECVSGEPMEWPTGPLWGRGRLASAAELQDTEKTLLASFPEWQNILEHTGVQQERRALKLMPSNGRQHWEGRDWVVTFDLPPGTYATCVLRELLQTVSKV
jgi:tRNA pseudouridine13 synthase